MKRRWTANQWVLTILFVILALVGIDVGRRMMAGPVQPKPEPVDVTPEFKVGDPAPAFTLPDQNQKARRFPDLVKRDTILTFSCGCAQCREFQTYLGKLEKELGPKAPDVVSVNSTDPMAAESWVKNTGLKQTLLYGPHKEGEVAVYKGAPCPRAFMVNADHKITFIGRSRGEQVPISKMGEELARQLGFSVPGCGGSGPKAPEMKWQTEAAGAGRTPQMPPMPAPAGHAEGDGHDHGKPHQQPAVRPS